MKTSILITVSALSLNLFLASAPSFAAEGASAVDNATTSTTTAAPAPAPISQKDLKAQLKTDKAQLKTDIKANGKDSDVVKADRMKLKEDHDAIVSQKAKKHMRHPKTMDVTTPTNAGAPVTQPAS
jgi:hypothetical protein